MSVLRTFKTCQRRTHYPGGCIRHNSLGSLHELQMYLIFQVLFWKEKNCLRKTWMAKIWLKPWLWLKNSPCDFMTTPSNIENYFWKFFSTFPTCNNINGKKANIQMKSSLNKIRRWHFLVRFHLFFCWSGN